MSTEGNDSGNKRRKVGECYWFHISNQLACILCKKKKQYTMSNNKKYFVKLSFIYLFWFYIHKTAKLKTIKLNIFNNTKIMCKI